MGREDEKPPQVKTRGHKLPTDGPDHTTRPKDIILVYGRMPGQ